MVSGSVFADNFVEISGTAEVSQEQIEKELEYTTRWRGTTNVTTCAIPAVTKIGKSGRVPKKTNPVKLKWKWGEDALPIVDRDTVPTLV